MQSAAWPAWYNSGGPSILNAIVGDIFKINGASLDLAIGHQPTTIDYFYQIINMRYMVKLNWIWRHDQIASIVAFLA